MLPRSVVIHPAVNRPNQLLGGDRELVLSAALITATLGLSLGTLWGVGLAVLFWIGAIGVLQRMGKADPQLRQVYLRHIRYRQFYPAKSGLHSRCAPVAARWR
ncbi:MAG TPA: conjugal transfer protein TrbD [Bryobacteraceae bacterium]